MTSKYERVREAVLLAAALAGVAHETLLEKAERPYLLALFAAMIMPALAERIADKIVKRR